MTIKDISDIEREKEEEAKIKISKDASDITEKFFSNLEDTLKRKKIERSKARSKRLIPRLLKWLGIIISLVVILDLLLGSVWLLKFLIKSLFYA